MIRSIVPSSSRQLSQASRSFSTVIRSLQNHYYPGRNESDFQNKHMFMSYVANNKKVQNDMSYSLSFASDEEAFTRYFTSKQPDARMQQQLHQSQNQLRVWRDLPLPSTMEAALAIDDRAVVITEAKLPFKITHVNEVWEGLCGFSAEESKGKTLSMLQGEETNLYAITNMMNVLMQGNEAGCVLTNYTKEGRRFRNHLRVRPLDGPTPRFVGILQEIRDGM